jgi:hypothetical protein
MTPKDLAHQGRQQPQEQQQQQNNLDGAGTQQQGWHQAQGQQQSWHQAEQQGWNEAKGQHEQWHQAQGQQPQARPPPWQQQGREQTPSKSIRTGRLLREANKVINSIKEEEEEGSRRSASKMKVGNKISKQATLPTQGVHVQQEDQQEVLHLQAPCHGLGI